MDRKIKVAGVQVRVREAGKGRPLVLIHGLGGSVESWSHNFDALSREARVIALDLPGFGRSDKPAPGLSIPDYRDFAGKFLARLRLERATLVGSSLGGQIACELAISRPDLVGRLVLVSPAGALPRSFGGSPALKRYVKVTSASSVEETRRALIAVDGKPVDISYARSVFERFSEPGAKQAFHDALRASAAAPRLQRRLGKIRAPMMVLWGKDDIMIPARFARPFVEMENCRVVLLERCGHRVHADKPGVFNRLVLDFVNERA